MMNRNDFLRSLLGIGVVGVGAAALAACGSDGTGDPGGDEPDAAIDPPIDAAPQSDAPPPDGQNTCSSPNTAIASNHGHEMTVSAADLESTTAKSYDIQGVASHAHTVTITPQQFATLKQTGTLTLTSTVNSGHPHTVTVTCA